MRRLGLSVILLKPPCILRILRPAMYRMRLLELVRIQLPPRL